MTPMLRSRAQIDREPRTVQFEIQHKPNGEDHPILPYVVRVLWPAVKNYTASCDKCKYVFRVDDDDTIQWCKKTGFPVPKLDSQSYVVVCECMGRIIE